MPPPPLLQTPPPLLYLITSGETTPDTGPGSKEFAALLALVEKAVAAHLSLIQIREKNLGARPLYELTRRAAALVRASSDTTRLLVNDRADVALAAGADGVHLTTRSLAPQDVRRIAGRDFLIGVSTHSLGEAMAARDGGADFATIGPIFETPAKRVYGPPLGTRALGEACARLAPFPLLALGGITRENVAEVARAGAAGVAAIRLFGDPESLVEDVAAVREVFRRR